MISVAQPRRNTRVAGLAIALCLGLAACGSQSTEPTKRGLVVGRKAPDLGGAPLYREFHALVIGIDNYAKANVLTGAIRDARAVAQVLEGHGARVELILDGEATRDRMRRALGETLPARLGPEDRALVYFAGHGATAGGRDPRGYLIGVGGALTDPKGTGLAMEEVQRWLAHYPSKHVMFVADACYSGLAVSSRSLPLAPELPNWFRKVATRRVRVSLVAGMADEQAAEYRNHGLFTYFLLQALGGNADLDGDGVMTSHDLVSYVQSNVREVAKRELNHDQNPQIGRIGEGEFIFLTGDRGSRRCAAGQYPHAGTCAPFVRWRCGAGLRPDAGGACVRRSNFVCAAGGRYDPAAGCRWPQRSRLAAGRGKRTFYDFGGDTIGGEIVLPALGPPAGSFEAPRGEGLGPGPAIDLAQARLDALPAGAAGRAPVLLELALLRWESALRHEEQLAACAELPGELPGGAPAAEGCRAYVAARGAPLRGLAMAHLDALLALQAPPAIAVKARLYRALLDLSEGELKPARKGLYALLSDPNAGSLADQVLEALAHVAFRQQDLLRADKFAKLGLEAGAPAARVALHRGWIAYNLGSEKLAVPVFVALARDAKDAPTRAMARAGFARSFVSALTAEEAEAAAAQITRAGPERDALLESMARRYSSNGSFRAALHLRGRLLPRAAPRRALRLRVAMARDLETMGDSRRVLEQVDAMARLLPELGAEDLSLRKAFGELLGGLGRRTAREAGKTRVPATVARARSLIELHVDTLPKHPRNHTLLFALGALLERVGDRKEALRAYRRCLGFDARGKRAEAARARISALEGGAR